MSQDPLLDDLKTLRATKGTSEPLRIAFSMLFPNCSNDISTGNPTNAVTNGRRHVQSPLCAANAEWLQVSLEHLMRTMRKR